MVPHGLQSNSSVNDQSFSATDAKIWMDKYNASVLSCSCLVGHAGCTGLESAVRPRRLFSKANLRDRYLRLMRRASLTLSPPNHHFKPRKRKVSTSGLPQSTHALQRSLDKGALFKYQKPVSLLGKGIQL